MQNSFYLYQAMIPQLRKSSNNLIQFTPFGYMWVRLNSKKLVASHSIYSMLEKEPFSEFFTVAGWRSFVHPKDLYKLIQAEEELLYTGLPMVAEYRLITQSGRHIFVDHHMYLSGSSTEQKIMSIIQDVTEQKTAAVIAEAMNESFFELDENFVFRRINEHALKFWQRERLELVGKNLTTVFPQIEGTAFHHMLSEARAEKLNIARQVIDPVTHHWLELSATPYADGLIVIFYDLQHEKETEQGLQESNRSLFAANKELKSLNAELKTFANIAASNYSETLRHLYINLEMIVTNDARNLSNSGRANLRRAQGAIQKMKLTTDDLLSFSRLHEVGIKENNVDLKAILEKIIEDFRKQPGHSLIVINCDHLPFVNGYPLLLSLLFHHLVDNAIKFRKKDNDHIVNVTCKESISGNDIAYEATDKNLKYHVISVEDNGIGFPQTESQKIFEMFSRLNEKGKYRGSGAGLALCKKIMEMHGGFITAEGIPDEGASFHCFFPFQPAAVNKT